jgi:hypothetical protein
VYLFELRLGRRGSKMRKVFLEKVQLLLIVDVKLRRHGSARDMSSGTEVVARESTGCDRMRRDATAGWDGMRQLPCDLRAAYRKEVVRVLLLLRELFLKLLVDVEWDCARVEARGRAEPAASTTTSSTKASARHFVGMRRLRRGCWWDVV